jgi:SAM-dependent methyltransferase
MAEDPDAERPTPMQVRRTEQTDRKWNCIVENLDSADRNLLDIGCDAGVLTRRAAETGRPALGVDRYERYEGAREHAFEAAERTDGLAFMQLGLTPENAGTLPLFDAVVCLSVYHYWHREFGRDGAETMLGAFAGANKVFFSASSLSERYVQGATPDVVEPAFESRDRESVVSYHEDVLRSALGESYSVELLDTVEYSIADVAQVPGYETEPRYVLLASRS